MPRDILSDSLAVLGIVEVSESIFSTTSLIYLILMILDFNVTLKSSLNRAVILKLL